MPNREGTTSSGDHSNSTREGSTSRDRLDLTRKEAQRIDNKGKKQEKSEATQQGQTDNSMHRDHPTSPEIGPSFAQSRAYRTRSFTKLSEAEKIKRQPSSTDLSSPLLGGGLRQKRKSTLDLPALEIQLEETHLKEGDETVQEKGKGDETVQEKGKKQRRDGAASGELIRYTSMKEALGQDQAMTLVEKSDEKEDGSMLDPQSWKEFLPPKAGQSDQMPQHQEGQGSQLHHVDTIERNLKTEVQAVKQPYDRSSSLDSDRGKEMTFRENLSHYNKEIEKVDHQILNMKQELERLEAKKASFLVQKEQVFRQMISDLTKQKWLTQ